MRGKPLNRFPPVSLGLLAVYDSQCLLQDTFTLYIHLF
jgi:hypothetical protein